MKTKIERGRIAEQIVQSYYEEQGFVLQVKNFTIRGGEIDLIMINDLEICFIEVKLVDRIIDISSYITKKKKTALLRTIKTYLWRFPTKKNLRIDVVFVRKNHIVDLFEYIHLE